MRFVSGNMPFVSRPFEVALSDTIPAAADAARIHWSRLEYRSCAQQATALAMLAHVVQQKRSPQFVQYLHCPPYNAIQVAIIACSAAAPAKAATVVIVVMTAA